MARRLTLLAAAALGCGGGPGPTWAQQAAMPLAWEPVPAAEVIDPARELAAAEADAEPPASQAEAEALLLTLSPTWDDYPKLRTLGPVFPTAATLPAGELDFSVYDITPLAGGGDAGGTGNQNYVGRIDLGVTDRLQLSAFFSEADDPLFAQPAGKDPNPANLWQSYGLAAQWQLLQRPSWALALGGSLELFNVGSGGCGSGGRDGNSCTPNIFNNSGSRVFTENVVGSITLPFSWQASRHWELTLVPGLSVLPDSQGGDQGGSGDFFGTSVTLGAGLRWRPSDRLSLFGSALVPLGPGTNSFNSALEYSRVPIFSGGVHFALNPRIGLEASITNGFGGTPATALLTLPSSNQPLVAGRFHYVPGAMDSAPLPFNARSRSLSLGGLTVNTAVVPPSGTLQLWGNTDSEGNRFGQFAVALSNDLLLQVISAGTFNGVEPVTNLVSTYTNDGSFNYRVGGKGILLHQLRGAPFSLGGALSVGQNSGSTQQGYVFGEVVATWEANPWLALNLNPKLAWNGVAIPFGIGLGANLQLGQSFQLIPELNLVTTSAGDSNGSLALRWLARRTMALDVYVSNAGGLLDLGQLLQTNQTRVGAKVTVQF